MNAVLAKILCSANISNISAESIFVSFGEGERPKKYKKKKPEKQLASRYLPYMGIFTCSYNGTKANETAKGTKKKLMYSHTYLQQWRRHHISMYLYGWDTGSLNTNPQMEFFVFFPIRNSYFKIIWNREQNEKKITIFFSSIFNSKPKILKEKKFNFNSPQIALFFQRWLTHDDRNTRNHIHSLHTNSRVRNIYHIDTDRLSDE